MSDLSQAHAAALASELESAAIASMRAYLRQPGGPGKHSLCRVLDEQAQEFRVLNAGVSDDWQNTLAERIKESSDELAAEDDAPEVFPGVQARLDALTLWKEQLSKQGYMP